MADPLRLMCVLAHPDDESLGTGGILAKYAAEGVETFVVTATRGERGWWGDDKDHPGLEALGKIREAELLAAAKVLGVRRVDFLDYVDGDLDQAHPAEAIAKIVLSRVQRGQRRAARRDRFVRGAALTDESYSSPGACRVFPGDPTGQALSAY